MHDSNGTEIKEEQLCCFNWSGDVKLGRVREVRDRTVRVRHLDPPAKGRISVMRNPRSIRIIDGFAE